MGYHVRIMPSLYASKNEQQLLTTQSAQDNNKRNRVNSRNFGCLLNTGNGPQSGPSVFNAAKGRKVALHCVERPKSGIW